MLVYVVTVQDGDAYSKRFMFDNEPEARMCQLSAEAAGFQAMFQEVHGRERVLAGGQRRGPNPND